MGNLVGILSTVILVSTVATLIFAVFAYIASRKRQQAAPASKHSGDFSIPDQQRAPDLPPEFILRMHEVRTNTIGNAEKPDSPPAKKTAVRNEPATPKPAPTPAPGTPAFRSLSEKRQAPESTYEAGKPTPSP